MRAKNPSSTVESFWSSVLRVANLSPIVASFLRSIVHLVLFFIASVLLFSFVWVAFRQPTLFLSAFTLVLVIVGFRLIRRWEKEPMQVQIQNELTTDLSKSTITSQEEFTGEIDIVFEAFLLSNMPKLHKYAVRNYGHSKTGLKCDPNDLVHAALAHDKHTKQLSKEVDKSLKLQQLYQAIDFVAQEVASQKIQTTDVHDSAEHLESTGIDQTEKKAVLGQALRKLSVVDRNVFLLRHNSSMSLKEIATQCNISEKLARNALSRAVSHLRRIDERPELLSS